MASASLRGCSGMALTRRSTFTQSITALVGHWLGATVMLPSMAALAAP